MATETQGRTPGLRELATRCLKTICWFFPAQHTILRLSRLELLKSKFEIERKTGVAVQFPGRAHLPPRMRKSLSHGLDAAPTSSFISLRSDRAGTPGERSTSKASWGDWRCWRFSLLYLVEDLDLEGDNGGVHLGTDSEPNAGGRRFGWSCRWIGSCDSRRAMAEAERIIRNLLFHDGNLNKSDPSSDRFTAVVPSAIRPEQNFTRSVQIKHTQQTATCSRLERGERGRWAESNFGKLCPTTRRRQPWSVLFLVSLRVADRFFFTDFERPTMSEECTFAAQKHQRFSFQNTALLNSHLWEHENAR